MRTLNWKFVEGKAGEKLIFADSSSKGLEISVWIGPYKGPDAKHGLKKRLKKVADEHRMLLKDVN